MIRVWGSDETVDQEDGLDPEYNRATFVEKYSCTEDLATPISHSCELAPRVAEASGRLSVKMFANLMKYANAEESCGFEPNRSLKRKSPWRHWLPRRRRHYPHRERLHS